MEKKGFVQEFKTFISRGNVVDMAVGVIIGSAFTKIVNSLVNDVLMPALGVLTGGVNFADLKFVITPATEEVAEVAMHLFRISSISCLLPLLFLLWLK